MNDWITATREVITTVLGHLTQQPAVRPGHRLRTSANDHRTARAVFASGTPSTISTRLIHKAKGESHDAVLLVAARPSGGRDQARTWVSTSTDDETAEEIRIAYVALTRARRYLAVALPQACRQEVIDLYVDRGFHLVD
jgi:DNA helicase II / ATP-dependent DNA helicase PcrA